MCLKFKSEITFRCDTRKFIIRIIEFTIALQFFHLRNKK